MVEPSALKAQYIRKLSSYEHIYWIYSGVICLQTLSAILFKPPIWTNKLRKAAIPKRYKRYKFPVGLDQLQIWNCLRFDWVFEEIGWRN